MPPVYPHSSLFPPRSHQAGAYLSRSFPPNFPQYLAKLIHIELTEGFPRRNAHYAPHSHHGLTTHLIRRGALTITYPKDERPTKETFGVGDRVDVEAGRVHEVWMGDEGCEYVIGE